MIYSSSGTVANIFAVPDCLPPLNGLSAGRAMYPATGEYSWFGAAQRRVERVRSNLPCRTEGCK